MQQQLIKRLVKYRNFVFHKFYFFSLKFVGNTFVSSPFDLASASIISLHVIADSSIRLAKYFQLWQLHLAGFQI